MTFYAVAWLSVSFSCPWGLSRAPEIIKQLVCDKSQNIAFKMYSKEELAEKQLKDIGASVPSLVLEISGGRANTIMVNWQPILESSEE